MLLWQITFSGSILWTILNVNAVKQEKLLSTSCLHAQNMILDRLHMKTQVCDIWLNSKHPGNLNIDLKFLFNPRMRHKIDKDDIEDFMDIVHMFLSKIAI